MFPKVGTTLGLRAYGNITLWPLWSHLSARVEGSSHVITSFFAAHYPRARSDKYRECSPGHKLFRSNSTDFGLSFETHILPLGVGSFPHLCRLMSGFGGLGRQTKTFVAERFPNFIPVCTVETQAKEGGAVYLWSGLGIGFELRDTLIRVTEDGS